MNERTAVVNWSGDHEETTLQLAEHLGKNKIRRKIFNSIYGRGALPRSKKQLMLAGNIRPRDAQQELCVILGDEAIRRRGLPALR
jgi:hypothetical protein